MTMTSPSLARPQPSRSIRMYERLLVLYPKAFRDEYGPDMVQLFADLVTHMADGRSGRAWPRVIGDLASSATRERLGQLRSTGGRQPSTSVVLALIAVVGGLLAVGPGGVLILPIISMLFIAGPVVGILQFRRAWVAWRTTGARPFVRLLVGVACFAPWVLLLQADDNAYYVGVMIVLALIWSLGLGAIWGVTTLVRSRRDAEPGHHRGRAIGLIVAAVVVLGGMAGAGFNSYLNSRPPPGDHSPGSASPDSRALWDAADRGDLDTVITTIAACADPFVHFDDGGRARSNAEYWAGVNHSGIGDPVDEPLLSIYMDIINRLKIAEATWTQRCNS